MVGRTIYIARHGERRDFVDPEWHKTAKLPHDAPLTERGNGQATDLGKKLADLNIKHVFASPFSRCVNTACNAAAECSPDLTVNVEPGFCEWLNADWYWDSDGGPVWRDLDSLSKEFPAVCTTYEPIYPMSHNIDGFPESKDLLRQRCEKTMRTVLERISGDGNVLVVGHGSSVEALYMLLVPGIPYEPVTCTCYTSPRRISFCAYFAAHFR